MGGLEETDGMDVCLARKPGCLNEGKSSLLQLPNMVFSSGLQSGELESAAIRSFSAYHTTLADPCHSGLSRPDHHGLEHEWVAFST